MPPSPPASNLSMPESLAPPDVGSARLLIGLLQGAVLAFLYTAAEHDAWPATLPMLFEPMLLVSLFAPVLLVSSLGHLGARRAAVWVGAAALALAALGLYDAWRAAAVPGASELVPGARASPLPSEPLLFVLVAGFFISHALVLAGAGERRRIASYPACFEAAWKLAVQLSFSALFVGVASLVLFLGATLFLLVELRFFNELLEKSWFVIPLIAFAYSWAMHITDVRPAIVRGIRGLLLLLMSWILPVATFIIGGFLASLLFTGLEPLWATRRATALLLGAAAVLVILINAAWQNGAAPAVAPVIRHSARAAALLLAPIVGIAAYALGLRVAEHGWTTDRIVAAACLLVAACYAAGYAFAALRKGWLDTIAGVNRANAFLVLALLLALFSPLADPARLAVNHQLARLASGKVAADRFDYAYLRTNGARYGRAALAQLKGATGKDAATIRQGAAEATRPVRPNVRRSAETKAGPADLARNLTVWPRTAQLPQSFLGHKWSAHVGRWGYPPCLQQAGEQCDAFLLDLSGDGKPEVIVIGAQPGGGATVMGEDGQGQWSPVAVLPADFAGCPPVRQSLIEGRFRAVAPLESALEIDGKRVWMSPKATKAPPSCQA